MLGIAIDAAVLMILLKAVTEEDIGLGTALVVALVASIGTSVLAIGLIALMGIFGLVVAAVIAASLLGLVVSAMFGVEIKRACLIGGVFMLVKIGMGLGLQWMMRS